MLKEKLTIEVEVPFREFPTAKLNAKARIAIRKFIRETVRTDLLFIPLYVEKSEDGSMIEDISNKVKIKIKKN